MKKNLMLPVKRYSLLLVVCFSSVHCVKHTEQSFSPIYKLLIAKPWYLSYTDSVYVDSTNAQHIYRIPATDCEKQEGVNFEQNSIYFMNLVCNPSPSDKLNGTWQYYPDSTITYGLASDTGFSVQQAGFILMITSDSLRLLQQSDFAIPDVRYKDLDKTKTYTR
jgi:hypothetical protein